MDAKQIMQFIVDNQLGQGDRIKMELVGFLKYRDSLEPTQRFMDKDTAGENLWGPMHVLLVANCMVMPGQLIAVRKDERNV